ncbi:MAG: hypothetical protein R8G66_10325 [Cytophagales bacterium]|nr:hypothetical protein [Cytophagales bacterium]
MDERPMHKAIKRTFEMGMDGGKPWIVEIDADVLLHESGILQLLRTASQRPENSFFHFGMVFDKLTNSFRSAGNKIIRTAHIPEAMSLLPKTTDQLRPDTYIRKEMALKGYHYYRDICLVGIHDFEQDYFDLYRKGYLQGVKNREKLERFIRGWPENWGNDPDYLAIQGGMTAGKAHVNDLPLAPSYYIDKFENWKMSIGFDFTKVPLASGLSKVDHYLSTILTNSKLQEFQDSCVNNQAKYHVRSDVNWQYKWMKLRYRLSQSRIFTGFSLSQKHSN